MDIITLSKSEMYFVNEISRKRAEHNQKVGATPTLYSNITLEQNNVVAYGGELAFAKHMNVMPSFTFDKYEKYDAVVRGYTVDVKTTNKQGGHINVKDLSHIHSDPPDYFALMFATSSSSFGFCGFISSSSIINPEHRVTQCKHPMYSASQTELIHTLPMS